MEICPPVSDLGKTGDGEGVENGSLFEAPDVPRRLAEVDWSSTPLGAPGTWPPSLRSVLRAVLTSQFPMWMAWGPELTFLSNDACCRRILGSTWQRAQGRPAAEVWAETWPEIEPRVDAVINTGRTARHEEMLLLAGVAGHLEERYHTLSYSPLGDDHGRVDGVLCIVSDDTERVIAEQRMQVLRELESDPTPIRTEQDVLAAVRPHLTEASRLLPFTLVYLFDKTGRARLALAVGITPGHAAAPNFIDASLAAHTWPAEDARAGETVVIDGLSERFNDLPAGGWADPPAAALMVPLRPPGEDRPMGMFVAALNPYRPFDEDYRGFVQLIANRIAAGLSETRRPGRDIADQLQASLMPSIQIDAEGLEIAAAYLAGTEGTEVGGDWYDVIDLGAGRTAMVVGDVMGRGVRAAAVMGQLRAMTIGYSRLYLPPSEILILLDSMVADLDYDQIVTCAYLIFDPVASAVTYANAGHPPPLLVRPTGDVETLAGTSPPLGTRLSRPADRTVAVGTDDLLTLYTDGLVERRGRDVLEGMDSLERLVVAEISAGAHLEDIPGSLISELVGADSDDDVALLVARITGETSSVEPAMHHIEADGSAVAAARRFTSRTLGDWKVSTETVDVAALVVSEMVTNAIVHGCPPMQLRLRLRSNDLVVEVYDGGRDLPRSHYPDRLEESGLGLQVVELLAARWGARSTGSGKVVWSVLPLR